MSNKGKSFNLQPYVSSCFRDSRFCDVKIRIRDRVFYCHRLILSAAFEYFERMFGGRFKETYASEICLHDVDAEVFEELLGYVYGTNSLKLSQTNVFAILRTIDYLAMKSNKVEKLCISYIRKNASSMENLLEVFVYTSDANKQWLTAFLNSYIVNHFGKFYLQENFVELPLKNLRMILRRFVRTSSSAGKVTKLQEFLLLDALIRWIMHSPVTRKKYLTSFMNIVKFQKITYGYVKFMTKRYKFNCSLTEYVDVYRMRKKKTWLKNCVSLNLLSTNEEHDTTDESDQESSVSVANPPSDSKATLHVWLCSKSILGFSRNKYIPDVFEDWSVTSEVFSNFKLTTSNDGNTIYRLESPSYNQQRFRAFRTIDLEKSSSNLTPPPVLCRSFQLTNPSPGQNFFCLYDDDYSFGSYHEQNVRPAVLLYSYPVNQWFYASQLKIITTGSCVTVLDHSCYAIGGKPLDGRSGFEGYVQAYDYRAPNWREISRTNTSFVDAVCCTINGRIYVSDGNAMELFDQVAGRWEIVPENTTTFAGFSRKKRIAFNPKKMIAYDNRLWMFGCYRERAVTLIYDPITRAWDTCLTLDDKFHSVSRYKLKDVVDAVLFNTTV